MNERTEAPKPDTKKNKKTASGKNTKHKRLTVQCLTFLRTANYKFKSPNSQRTNALPRPLIRADKIVIYDNTVQSQITLFVSSDVEVDEKCERTLCDSC